MNPIKTETSTLDNGLTIASEYLPYSESFALGITVKAGAIHTSKTTQGLAHALEHLVFKRTKNYNAKEIAEKFESLGAFVNAFTSNEFTCFYVRALSYNYDKIFELLSNLIINTAFDEEEVNREKNVIIQEINASFDDPEDLIFEKADELIFGYHPFGYSILGNKSNLKKINIEQIEKFKSKFYLPNRIIISSSGNINHEHILNLAKKQFGNLPVNEKNVEKPIPEFLTTEKKEIIIKDSVNMVHTLMGKRFDVNDRFYAAFLSIILGDGMSSRLYQKIRDEEGLAYSIYTSLQSYSKCGIFYIYTAGEVENKDILISKIENELKTISDKGINEEEFSRAKELLKSGYALEMEDLASRMQSIAKKIVLYNKIVNISDIIELYDTVTYKEVNKFAQNFCEIENWHKVLIIPKK